MKVVYVINDQYALEAESVTDASEKFKSNHEYDSVNSVVPLSGNYNIIDYWVIKHLFEVFTQSIKQGKTRFRRRKRRYYYGGKRGLRHRR